MTNQTDVLSGKLTFHEWMDASEKIIGEEGMAVFTQFVLGNIPFEECLKQMYEVFPQDNYEILRRLVAI